jgi:hypothetical protein
MRAPAPYNWQGGASLAEGVPVAEKDPIRITAAPLTPGRYTVTLGDRLLIASARCPLLEAARLLLAEGTPPEVRIEMWHQRHNFASMTGTVGRLSALSVLENDRQSPRFAKFVPFDRASAADSPFPQQRVAQDGQDAPAGLGMPPKVSEEIPAVAATPLSNRDPVGEKAPNFDGVVG